VTTYGYKEDENENLTHSHIHNPGKQLHTNSGSTNKQLINTGFSQFCTDEQQQVSSYYDRKQNAQNRKKCHRFSEKCQSEPNLPLSKEWNAIGRSDNVTLVDSVVSVSKYQVKALQSIEENKRWRAHRLSQSSSNPIKLSTRCITRNIRYSKKN
jgi:hypothetical protein